jgi:hypothetical protein
MKKLSTIAILTASTALALATASFAGAVPNDSQGSRTNQAAAIPQLQVAARQALADGRNGGKNNPEYGRKNYQINQLIDKIQSGQQVDPAEIDKAMEPVHIW